MCAIDYIRTVWCIFYAALLLPLTYPIPLRHMHRSFENTTGTASKFWHITTHLTGPQTGVTVHYGRIGSE